VADTPFSTFAYPVGPGTTNRTTSTRFSEVLNVKDFGAVGDQVADDTAAIQACFDAAYGPVSNPHSGAGDVGSPLYTNKAVFIPAGSYKTTAPLLLTQVSGAHIFGAGRLSTSIKIQTGGSAVIKTNGCAYSKFERMALGAPAGSNSVCFDLDWVQTVGNTTALQSNTFSDMAFGGADYGLRIGQSLAMGSETTVLNCSFYGHAVAGLATKNQNALMTTVIGGNFENCAIGISCPPGGGSVPIIEGVSFQGQTDYDIKVLVSNPDCYSITGCRSESVNFAWFQGSSGVHIAGCTQPAKTGTFAFADGPSGPAGFPGSLSIDNCSAGGQVYGNCTLHIRGTSFGVTNPFSSFSGTIAEYGGQPFAVSTLPPVARCAGLRVYVKDSTVAGMTGSTSNFGAPVSGGGTNLVPVYSDGTTWRIG
jgi:hypothetical protein